jgi:alpha-glucosidase
MSKKRIAGLLPLLLLCIHPTVLHAQITEPGKITGVVINTQSVDITTENAFANITVYSPNIIRVRMDKQKLKQDFSYSVIASPIKTSVKINQDDTAIFISTDSIKTIIHKTPFSIAFFTNAGDTINEDETGLTTSWVGSEVTTYKHMRDGERFIGLGEKTGPFDRTGSGFTNWNSDTYGYTPSQDPIYSSIPFYIGIHHNINYGIFLDNTFQTDFNFGASNNRFSSFGARNGEMNYYFIYHTHLADIITSYTSLTGRMKLPPMWSLGYQQNRFSYYPDKEVLRVAETFREKNIPVDGITLDILYMDSFKLFTWDKLRFPDPVGMTSKLKSMGIHTTVVVDPGIKIQPGAPAFERGLKDSVYLTYPDGKYYAAQVWPGWCYFTDFTNPIGRNYWSKEMKFFANNGVSGIWNDMNEFATWGQKVPSNIMFDFDGRKTTTAEAHNIYALEMSRAGYDGARLASNERPFILTRAGFAGLQRYCAIWTGDNVASDEHMLLGVRLMCGLGVSGIPFTGVDVAGFIGTTTTDLYTRWMQLGAFFPYYRNHKELNTRSSEPWTYGEETLDNIKPSMNLRYKLMPYLYSSFYESTQDGLPVMRSLAIDYTFDPLVYEDPFQNQFEFGKSVMVVPVLSTQTFTKLYLPKGTWYEMYTDSLQAGGNVQNVEIPDQELPAFVKESSIIPMQSLVQSTEFAPTDTLILNFYKGTVPNTYVYYEDDGKSFDYEKGAYYKRTINYNPATNTIIIDKADGQFISKFKNIALILHGFDDVTSISVNNKNVPLNETRFSYLAEQSIIDKSVKTVDVDFSEVMMTVIKNDSDKITIKY